MNGPMNDNVKFDEFEKNLAGAMHRVNPPANFAHAVMQRVEREAKPMARVLAMPSRWRVAQMWAAGAVAATLVISVGMERVHHHQERAEATRQFEVAMQIEQQALERTREKLSRSGISLGAE